MQSRSGAPNPASVLLVVRDRSDAGSIRRAFERSADPVELHVVGSLAEAREQLKSSLPDLAIIDLDLPDGRGVDLFEAGDAPFPFVIMSERAGDSLAVESVKRGALDYIVKSEASLEDMPRAAARALREWSHIAAGRRAEKALRQSEARYRALTENASDLIAEVDEHGTLLFASPNHRELLGIEPDQLIGTPGVDRIHPSDRQSLIATVSELIEHGVAVDTSYRFRKGDDSWCWLESSARSYHTPTGEFRVVITSRDVSDRRELEERLRQSQKLEAVGQLAGGIAHDFNNLLTVISGYGEYLTEVLEPGGAEREAAQQIALAAERSAALTRQLLAFSRSQVLQPRPLDLNEIMTDLGKLLWRLIGDDIELRVELDPEIASIEADPGQIEQVVVNLAINARDAMPDGGRLTLSTTRTEDGGVRLSVGDSGRGMDELTRQRIFEPFFTTKPVGRGTGLGLSTVYGIVHQSGGTISVETEPGQGTRFDIVLPAAQTPIAEGASGAPPTEGGGETVLVVEDEPRLRDLVRDGLIRRGFAVVAAADGDEALAALVDAPEPFQVLLTDIVMPGLDGLALAERARGICPELTVVFMSGFAQGPAAKSDRDLPADAILVHKPFRTGDLATVLREALHGSEKGISPQ